MSTKTATTDSSQCPYHCEWNCQNNCESRHPPDVLASQWLYQPTTDGWELQKCTEPPYSSHIRTPCRCLSVQTSSHDLIIFCQHLVNLISKWPQILKWRETRNDGRGLTPIHNGWPVTSTGLYKKNSSSAIWAKLVVCKHTSIALNHIQKYTEIACTAINIILDAVRSALHV